MTFILSIFNFTVAAFLVANAYCVYSTGLNMLSFTPPSMGAGTSIAIDAILAYFVFKSGFNSVFNKVKTETQP